ncbi:carbonic anhydrase [Mycetocola lacteus]|uniref:Carbonic anhydrase n=1 Tax=Mycetocola lacteus TaxID=76637 RepID=A0A3L7AM85_9MICO|nr:MULTISPECIES: carbonic anhydrase [Mycetocola]MCS4275458.1 carbonic anhydrase [Mycetocola sp. BIGb0189]RLP80850.1 carbonic anhydrase [Mycetocola lacteus]RLP84635.1 carbonic anhydrase [Mycetocola lacteus]
MSTMTPGQAWAEMVAGNERFVSGEPLHPRQDVERRHQLASVQTPDAALFGCSDSRLSAEIIFDKGLGDLFVVRNAGQVISDSVLGSLEYAVGVLKVPLIVVLGHDACGAVQAAISSCAPDAETLPPNIAGLIRQIVPSVVKVAGVSGTEISHADPAEVGKSHLRSTVAELLTRSEMINRAVAEGTLAVVGANYRLTEGTAVPDVTLGNLDPTGATSTKTPNAE